MLARLLASPLFRQGLACQGKQEWVALLKNAGFDEHAMHQWHIDFEADSPAQHAAFLTSLGLDADEVAAIQAWSAPAG
jgi:hypothetical protein